MTGKLDAVEYLKVRLDAAKEADEKIKEGRIYGMLGIVYNRRGDFRQAIDYHTKALAAAEEVGDQVGQGNAFCNLGNDYQCMGGYKQALECHEKNLKIVEELEDKKGVGVAHGNIGICYHSLGSYQKAIDHYNKSLSIAIEVKNRASEGKAYGNLGNTYHNLGDFQNAIEHHKKDLTISKEVGDKNGEGCAYGNLGNAHRRLGNFNQALYYHKLRLTIAKELGNRAGEGRAYCSIACVYQDMGNFKEAIKYHQEDLRIAEEVGDRAQVGRAYSGLGSAFRSTGDFKRAIEHHNLHLSIARELNDSAAEGTANLNLGSAHQSLGNLKEATEYYERSLRIAKAVEDKARKAVIYGNLGAVYCQRRDLEKAVEYQEKNLKIVKKVGSRAQEGHAYSGLGSIYLSLGNFKQAIHYHKHVLDIAREVGDRTGQRNALIHLGNAYCGLQNFKEAGECYKHGLSIAEDMGDWVGKGTASYSLGLFYALQGSLDEALEYFRSSVQMFNTGRLLLQENDDWKISLRDKYQHAHTALWRTLLKTNKAEEALLAAEQGRAQALMDLMESRYDLSRSVEPESYESAETISAILSSISTCTQMVFLAVDGDTINFWVLCKGINDKAHNVQLRQKKTERGTTNYGTTLDDLVKNALDTIRTGAKCEDRSLGELRDETILSSDESQDTISLIQDNPLCILYDNVISPIEDLLLCDELIIVPDGPLWLVPFAAFVGHDSKYLCESFRIRLVPSLTSLKLITDCPDGFHSESGALLVGDPWVQQIVNRRGKKLLPQLPFARKEVEMIGKILNTAPLTGEQATKNEILRRLASVALVHIAAHGRMETGEIALAPNPERTTKIPEEKDYMLTMSDVLSFQLRAKLVVLSCCHSGKGKVTADGVVGIARAFLGAGARSVLVSLWAILDEAGLAFMTSFYQHLRDGKSVGMALHLTTNCLRESEKYREVTHWASFVLFGDDVTLEFATEKEERRK